MKLKKATIALFSIAILTMVIGCKSKIYSYNQLIDMNPTHNIQSINVKHKITNALNDKENFDGFESEIIILYIKKNNSEYEICISRTDYNTFKNYRPDLYHDLKGYSKFQNIPVLLFGDIDKGIFKKNTVDFYHVLGNMPEYDIKNPPIIYEPRMICDSISIR